VINGLIRIVSVIVDPICGCLQTLIYAGQQMADDRQLMEYHVPPVCHQTPAQRLASFSKFAFDAV